MEKSEIEAIIKQKSDQPFVRLIQMHRNSYEIRMRRLQISDSKELDGFYAKDATLDEQELQLFKLISQQIKNGLRQEGLSADQADALFDYCMEPIGQKMFVQSFIEPPLIMGVPYMYFVANAFISLTVFIASTNFDLLLLTSLTTHFISFIYYYINRQRLRQNKIHKILTEGIKI